MQQQIIENKKLAYIASFLYKIDYISNCSTENIVNDVFNLMKIITEEIENVYFLLMKYNRCCFMNNFAIYFGAKKYCIVYFVKTNQNPFFWKRAIIK